MVEPAGQFPRCRALNATAASSKEVTPWTSRSSLLGGPSPTSTREILNSGKQCSGKGGNPIQASTISYGKHGTGYSMVRFKNATLFSQ